MKPFSTKKRHESVQYLGFIQWLHIINKKKRNIKAQITFRDLYEFKLLNIFSLKNSLDEAMIYDHLKIHILPNKIILRLGSLSLSTTSYYDCIRDFWVEKKFLMFFFSIINSFHGKKIHHEFMEI